MMNGKEIIILKDGQAIAATKSDEIQVGCETIPISSPSDGAWTAAIAGRKSWAITVGFLVANVGNVFASINMVGNTFELAIQHSSGSNYMWGYAICTTFKVTATKGNLVQGSFAFQGTGPLESGYAGRVLD
jgi:hypothetical protein